jgi:hypothetical protein
VRQNSSAFNIAQNDAGLRQNFPSVNGVGDGGKV